MRPGRIIIDLGTGDGRAVLARAAIEPDALVIGLDANAAAMAEMSRRATRSTRDGGRPNALYAVGAAETPPTELLGAADEVIVQFPWGSLLRGSLALDDAAAAGIASLLRPHGLLIVLVATASHDRLPGVPTSDELLTPAGSAALAARWASHAMVLTMVREATPQEVKATRSSWARRLLGRGHRRRVARIVLQRASHAARE